VRAMKSNVRELLSAVIVVPVLLLASCDSQSTPEFQAISNSAPANLSVKLGKEIYREAEDTDLSGEPSYAQNIVHYDPYDVGGLQPLQEEIAEILLSNGWERFW